MAAARYGLDLRRWAWDYTQDARFTGDITAGFRWGGLANEFGLYEFYDNVESGVFPNQQRRNDYPPLRLSIVTWWRGWAYQHYPNVNDWRNDYDLTYPMLRFNTIAEGASAIFTFFIVWTWRRRGMGQYGRWHTGLASATVGGLVFWFNPAVIWDGHCWPQWDVWLVPFFLAAVLLASFNCWLFAGIMLAIGAAFKGQLLLAAPVIFLWPLFRFRFGALLRVATGFLAGIALIAWPWMQPSGIAFRWYFLLLGALALCTPFILCWKLHRWWVLVSLIAGAFLLAWPWGSTAEIGWRWLPLAMIGLMPLGRFMPKNLKAHAYVLVIALAVLLMMPLFDASGAWYRVGFAYGTEKFERMLSGTGAYNIPSMMRRYLGWPTDPQELVNLPYFGEMAYTKATRIIYAMTLLLCGIGAAIQDYRRDARLLAAIVAPWLLFFMILTQMHGRYPLWAAGISALLFGVSTGMGLLGVIVALVSAIGIAQNQLAFEPGWSADTFQLMRQLDPHLGWVLLLSAAIYVWHAIAPSPRRLPKLKSLAENSHSEVVAPRIVH